MTNFSEYLRDPLDEEYLVIPGDSVEKGSLPSEELEVRNVMNALKLLHLEQDDLSVFSRIFKTRAYMDWEAKYSGLRKRAKELILSSGLHRAAFHRLVNSIPRNTRDYDKAFWDALNIQFEKAA